MKINEMTKEKTDDNELAAITLRVPKWMIKKIKVVAKQELRPINSQGIQLLREALDARGVTRTEEDE